MPALTALSRTAAHVRQPAVARLGALLLAASVPVLLLHVDYQPQVSLDLGGTDASLKLSDLAVLAVVVAAVVALARDGIGLLRPALVVLAPVLALLAWIGVGVVVGAVSDRPYALGTHLVTAAGFLEYALLAPAVAVLVRTPDVLRLVLWTLVGWLAVLDVVGLAQFAGIGDALAGARQPSWIGYHDFAAAGATTLAIGLVAIAVGERWPVGRLREAACATGALGLVLSGSVGGALGLVAAAALVVAGRRAGPLADRAPTRRRHRDHARDRRRRRRAPRRRPRAVRPLRRPARGPGDDERGRADLLAPDAARLLRPPGLRRPPGDGRRLAGDPGVRDARAVSRRRAPPLPGRRGAGVPVARRAVRGPERLRAGARRPRRDRARALRSRRSRSRSSSASGSPSGERRRRAPRSPAPPSLLACAGAWTAQGLVAGLPLDALTWFGVGLVAVTISQSLTDG